MTPLKSSILDEECRLLKSKWKLMVIVNAALKYIAATRANKLATNKEMLLRN
jgi:hypothetical protein